MSFQALSSSISNLVQATAFIVGGAWAYLKFVRGRTFRYRAGLEIAAEPFSYGHDPVLRVQATMHNQGLSKIDLSLQDEKQVVVHAALVSEWVPDVNIAWEEEESSELIRTALFQRHTWLESGETIQDELLIPVGAASSDDVVAYRVRAMVKAASGGAINWALRRRDPGRRRKLQVWTADLVVPAALEPRDSDGSEKAERYSTTSMEEPQ